MCRNSSLLRRCKPVNHQDLHPLTIVLLTAFLGTLARPSWARERADRDADSPASGVLFSEVGIAALVTRGQGAGVLAPALGAGYQRGAWTVGVTVGGAAWRSPLVQGPSSEWLLAVNPGMLLEWRFAQGKARMATSVGPSFFVETSSVLDASVTPGLFVDLRPLGFRFQLSRKWHLGIDPLGVRLLMSELSAIPIYDTQFHTTLRVELLP